MKDYTAHRVPGLPDGTKITHVEPAGDRILIGTANKGLWVLPTRQTACERVEGLTPISCVLAVTKVKGRTMIGTRDIGQMNPYVSAGAGVWVLVDGERSLRKIEGLPGIAQAVCFYEFAGQTLIGTYEQGLWSVKDDGYTAVQIEGPPQGDQIFLMAIQGERALIGTFHHGIWCLNAGRTRAIKIPDRSEDNGVFGPLCFVHSGHRTLIGTSCFGLWSIEDVANTAVKIGGIPGDDVVRCMVALPDRILIGSMAGFYSLPAGANAAARIGGLPKGSGVLRLVRVGSKVFIDAETSGLWVLKDGMSLAEPVSDVPENASLRPIIGASDRAVFVGAGRWVIEDGTAGQSRVTGLPDNAWVGDIVSLGGRTLIGTDKGLWAIDF